MTHSDSTHQQAFVGRDSELQILADCWRQAASGKGQTVLVSGEIGIGKTRLLKEVARLTGQAGNGRLSLCCKRHHNHSALYPLIAAIESIARLGEADTPSDRIAKLRAALSNFGETPDRIFDLFDHEFSSTLEEDAPDPSMKTIVGRPLPTGEIASWLCDLSKHTGLLITVDDAHFIDPTSQDLLRILVGEITDKSILLIVSHNDQVAPTWCPSGRTSKVQLNRMSDANIERLVRGVDVHARLSDKLVDDIVLHSNGLPLLAEQFSWLIRGANNCLGDLKYPGIDSSFDRLQTTLRRHFEREPEQHAVAEICAVIGDIQPTPIVAALCADRFRDPAPIINELLRHGLLTRTVWLGHAAYEFASPILRDAIYTAIPAADRVPAHDKITRHYDDDCPHVVRRLPDIVALHHQGARNYELAAELWRRAGERAMRHGAYLEALHSFESSLDAIERMPESPARDRMELPVQLRTAVMFAITEGYGAIGAGGAYQRARNLSQRLDRSIDPSILYGQWAHHWARAELATARNIAGELFEGALSRQEPTDLIMAHRVAANTLWSMGQFAAARNDFEKVLRLYDPSVDNRLAEQVVIDPKIVANGFIGHILWMSGFPQQALSRISETVRMSRALDQPYSLAFATGLKSSIHLHRREIEATMVTSAESLSVSREREIFMFMTHAHFVHGWSIGKQGKREDGLSEMWESFKALETNHLNLFRPFWLSLFAELNADAGHRENTAKAISEALISGARTGDVWYQAESYRLKGENLLAMASDNDAAAEECFWAAIDLSRNQDAKSWELRATTSLAKLWSRLGKGQEARAMLSEIYNWFKEGLDTADLKDARRLLDQLQIA